MVEIGVANVSLGRSANVSSTYSGYNPTTITDGVIDPYGGTSTTWSSDENAGVPHWIEIDFGENKTIVQVVIRWAWNHYRSAWMTSQQYYIQRWNGSDYVNIGVVNAAPAGPVTTTDIPVTGTSRIRIYQPTNMGPPSYRSVIWLTELEVYGD